ncbi:radical SAM protein [Lonsdalea populi]|uniref:radical SAM protein n=1 Tax=Lonsdalea populi TaxID=1172565 RepID=UPI000DD454B3|nr:radical SAM protein [Lonsdalea populi]
MKTIYCYDESGSPRNNELSTGNMLSLIRKISKAGATDVILMGGEPFKRNDIFVFIDEIVRNNLRFSILSHGLSSTTETIELLKKYHVVIHVHQP